MHLSSSQTAVVERIADTLFGASLTVPALLLTGTTGCGKRTIAKGVAKRLGLRFVEVPLLAPVQTIKDILFGGVAEANQSSVMSVPPGEAGRSYKSLIYLSRLESVDDDLLHPLFRLISRRSYVDALGQTWSLDDTAVVISGLTDSGAPAPRITAEHWLCTAFEQRIVISVPNISEVAELTRAIIDDLHGHCIENEAVDFLTDLPQVPGNLHSLRRLLSSAVARANRRSVSRYLIEDEIAAECRSLMLSVRFGGLPVAVTEIDYWWAQFPTSLKPIAAHLMHLLATTHYIDERRLLTHVEEFAQRVDCTGTTFITFSGQVLGRTSIAMARAFKARIQLGSVVLRNVGEVADGGGRRGHCILMVDMLADVEEISRCITDVAAYGASVSVVILVALRSQFKALFERIGPLASTVDFAIHRVITESSSCFSQESDILKRQDHRDRLKQLCISSAFPELPMDLQLGRLQLGLLIIFPDSVPNSTLPLFWNASATWKPLFPNATRTFAPPCSVQSVRARASQFLLHRSKVLITCGLAIICATVILRWRTATERTFRPESTGRSHYVRQQEKSTGVVVFVHGVLGDANTTWSSGNSYWPKMLASDPVFDKQNIFVYQFPTPMMRHTYTIDEVAENLRLTLSDSGVLAHNEVSFLSHSMGGVVTRAFLLKYARTITPRIRLAYFFATPTTGAPMARLATVLSQNPQFGGLYPLSADHYLDWIQSAWLASRLDIRSFCAYEIQPLFGAMIVVDRQSATHLCSERMDPMDRDHLQIVKPSSYEDAPYRAFRAAFEESRVARPVPSDDPGRAGSR